MKNIENVVERHYWRAVTLLVILILAGAAFWAVRRFSPAMFLGTPDLIVVPNNDPPQNRAMPPLILNKPVLLNINTASDRELETLPNIGEKVAQRIVDYRAEHGDFATVEELQKVKGIGMKTLEKLRPFVDVE